MIINVRRNINVYIANTKPVGHACAIQTPFDSIADPSRRLIMFIENVLEQSETFLSPTRSHQERSINFVSLRFAKRFNRILVPG